MSDAVALLLRRRSVIRRLSHAWAHEKVAGIIMLCYDGKSPINGARSRSFHARLSQERYFGTHFVPLACAPGVGWVRCCQAIGSVVSPHDGHSVSFQVALLVDVLFWHSAKREPPEFVLIPVLWMSICSDG